MLQKYLESQNNRRNIVKLMNGSRLKLCVQSARMVPPNIKPMCSKQYITPVVMSEVFKSKNRKMSAVKNIPIRDDVVKKWVEYSEVNLHWLKRYRLKLDEFLKIDKVHNLPNNFNKLFRQQSKTNSDVKTSSNSNDNGGVAGEKWLAGQLKLHKHRYGGGLLSQCLMDVLQLSVSLS